MFNENNDVLDVDFEDSDISETKEIKGFDGIYYSTGQVAKMLDSTDSKVRYYSNYFDKILNLEIINKQRKFKKADIDKLKFIFELKDEGMTRDQILSYCQEVDFEEGKGIQVKESNPLSIQTLGKVLMEQQKIEFDKLKKELFERTERQIAEITKQHLDHQNKLKESLLEEVSITVDDVLSDKFNSLQDSIEEMKQEVKIATVSLESIKEFENPKTFIGKLTNLFSKR